MNENSQWRHSHQVIYLEKQSFQMVILTLSITFSFLREWYLRPFSMCMCPFTIYIFSVGEDPITRFYFTILSWIFKIIIFILLWCFEFWVSCCLVLHWIWFCLGIVSVLSCDIFSYGLPWLSPWPVARETCKPKKNILSLQYFCVNWMIILSKLAKVFNMSIY